MSEDVLDRPGAGRSALRGGSLRTAGFMAAMLVSVATAPLVVRHLGVEGFGRYVAVLSIVTVVGGLTELGLNQLALREYAADAPAARARTLPLLHGVRLATGAVAIGVAVAFAAAVGYESTLLWGTAAAGLSFVVGGVATLFSTALQGDLRFGALTAVEVGRQVVTAALMVGLVLAGAGVMGFLVALVPAAAVALAANALLVRGRFPWRPAFDARGSWLALRDTLPYAAATALHVAYFRVAMIVVALLATELEAGYYATAFRVVEVVIAFPPLLVGAAFPILARSAEADLERFDAAMRRILELSLLAGLGLALPLALGAPAVVDVLVGEPAQGAIDALRLLSVAMVPAFLAYATGYALLSLKRYRAILLADAIAVVVGLAGALALVPALGADGAALASIGAECALAGANLWLLRAARPRAVGLGGWGVALLAAAVAAGVPLVLGLPAVPAALAAAALFALILAALGRFPAEARALFGR